MVKELMHDPIFLAGRSEDATKEDILPKKKESRESSLQPLTDSLAHPKKLRRLRNS